MSTTGQLYAEVKKIYDEIGSVYCKPLKSNIIFNKEGLKHLKFKRNGRRRDDSELRYRLHILHYAPEVIKNAISAKQVVYERTIGGNLVPVTFTELHGIVDGMKRHIIVIIRQFPLSSPHFYSIRERRSAEQKKKYAKKPG